MANFVDIYNPPQSEKVLDPDLDNSVSNIFVESEAKKSNRQTRSARVRNPEQQKQSLDAMGELVELRNTQIETERKLRACLQKMELQMKSHVYNMNLKFHQCASKVRTYVACLMIMKRRDGMFRLQMLSVSVEEGSNPEVKRGITTAAYTPTLDYRTTEEHLRKWMRAQGIRKRQGWYVLASTKLDEYLVTPVDVGYGETMHWAVCV